MKKFYSGFLSLVVIVLATCLAGKAEAQATHQTILNAVNGVQSAVNGVNTKVDRMPPAWSQTLPAAQRFVLVIGGAAALDKETGLVWEKSPSPRDSNWLDAQLHCNISTVGGRFGWRLPTIQELASLVDPSVPEPGPTLPPGHPFSIGTLQVQYWSATTNADPSFNPSAWGVNFQSGGLSKSFVKVASFFSWCVRGGQGVDPQ
jgi:hypothetical protein